MTDIRQEQEGKKGSGLFIGLCGEDIIYELETLPEENDKSRTNSYRTAIGGPAANAALTYARLGGNPVLASCIGNSPKGIEIKRKLEEKGVHILDFCQNSRNLPGISTIFLHSSNGSRTVVSGQMQTDRCDIGSIDVSGQCREWAFCLYDCNLGIRIIPLLQQLKEAGLPLVLDAGSWKPEMEEVMELADEVIASEKLLAHYGSLGKLAGRHPRLKHLAASRGEKPLMIYGEDDIALPETDKARDTLGAGDVLHGAYCHFRYDRGMDFRQALSVAAAVATHKVRFRGVEEGLDDYIRTHRYSTGLRSCPQEHHRRTVYIDMDNVLVDFRSGTDSLDEDIKEAYAGRLDEVPHIFSRMKPLEGAIASFRRLAEKYDVYILSTAPWENPSAWSEKLEWVKRYLGTHAYKKLILTHHKDLNSGDYLIDDRIKNGAGDFPGELIRFGSPRFPDWKSVVEYLD